MVSIPELVRLQMNQSRIKFSNQIQNLDDEEDPEDGDADVGSEEHVESEVETVIEDSGNYLMLISNDQVIQQTNILG